jgi:PAS domain S-box-containing protein
VNGQHNSAGDSGASPQRDPRTGAEARLEKFEQRQTELWRLTFFLLLIITVVFAWFAWASLRTEKSHAEALAYTLGLVVLVLLLGAYIWKKTQEIAELKGLVRGLDQKEAGLPSDRQLDQLFQMISKSQQGFRDLIDSFDDILLALSLDGEIRAANRSFSELLDRPFQKVIGRSLAELVEDEGAGDGSKESLARGMAKFLEKRHWTGVVHIRLKDRGTTHYFECVAHAMLRDDKVHGLTVLARDITSLRRNEARFTELFETLQEGIYIVTPEDRVLEVNPALVRMLGYASKEELLGKKVTEVFVDETQRAGIIREVNRQPSPVGREITLRKKNGQPLVCLNTATAIRDSSGKIIRYQGALVDITERREIEKRLYKEQEFARRLVDSFPDLIFVVDTQKRYTYVSPRVPEVMGYEPSECVGMIFGERTHPDECGAVMGIFEDMLKQRRNFASIEIQVKHKLGEWRRLKCNFSPLLDEKNKIEGVVISGRDVTEVKRLEEQLIQAEKLAAMGQMLAGVAHELNNPLTAILGVSELLRDRQGIDDATKRQLEMTHRQARRAARNVIERTLQLHEHALKRNNVEADFHQQPELPYIVGDANQLIQVFLNLISNAQHAIKEVRTAGHIRVRLGQAFNRVYATVQDDGVGIKPEALPRLFDPFFTTKRPGGGTGLGLSICMSIVREHGGNIEVDSLPGGGACFTVYLPIALQERGRNLPRDLDTSSGEWIPPSLDLLQHRTVLVLDDEESIRMLLSEGLAAHGLKVDSAGTAEQALSLVLGRKYDVLLCDLNLSVPGPNGDGRNVAERLVVAAGANKPEVIFMSGELGGEDNPAKPELTRWLQKPFRISDVLNLLVDYFSHVPTGSARR